MGRRKKSSSERGEIDTRSKVLQVSLDLFSKRGFAQTTTRDIAGAMGMSITNIYHYYGSKGGILLAILTESVQNLQRALLEVAELDMDPLERLRLLLHTHIRLAVVNHHESRIFSIDRDHLPEDARQFIAAKQREFVDLYAGQLLALEREGVTRTKHRRVLALNALGVIAWLIRWYHPEGKLSLDEVVEEVETFILQGITGTVPETVARVPAAVQTTAEPSR